MSVRESTLESLFGRKFPEKEPVEGKQHRLEQTKTYYAELLKSVRDFGDPVDAYTQSETLLAGVLRKRNADFDDGTPLQDFYNEVGRSLVAVGNRRRLMYTNVSKELERIVGQLSPQADTIYPVIDQYNQVRGEFDTQKKRITSLEAQLERAEERTKAEGSIRGKDRRRDQEDRAMSQLEEEIAQFTNVQMLTAYMKRLASNELDFVAECDENEFVVHGIGTLVKEYRAFFDKGLDTFTKLERQYRLRERAARHRPTQRPSGVSMKNLDPEFLPDTEKVLFGISPDEVMLRPSEQGEFIPRYIELMIEYVRKDLTRTGIFRLSGDMEKMAYLKRHIDMGRLGDYSDITNPNTITSLLKEYLRMLPPESFPYEDKFDALNDITGLVGVAKKKVKYCQDVIVPSLTPYCQQLFFTLFELFRDICKFKKKNKMTPKNMSVCLAISLFKMGDDETSPMIFIKLTPRIQAVFAFFIERFNEIFPNGNRPELVAPPKEVAVEVDWAGLEQAGKQLLGEQFVANKAAEVEAAPVAAAAAAAAGGAAAPATPGGKKRQAKRRQAAQQKGETGAKKGEVEIFNAVMVLKEVLPNVVVSADSAGGVRSFSVSGEGIHPLHPGELHTAPVHIIEDLGSGVFITGSHDSMVGFWSTTQEGVLTLLTSLQLPSPAIVIHKCEAADVFVIVTQEGMKSYNMSDFSEKVEFQVSDIHQSCIIQLVEFQGYLYTVTQSDGFACQWEVDGGAMCTKKLTVPPNRGTIVALCKGSAQSPVVAALSNGKYASFNARMKPMVLDTLKKAPAAHMMLLNEARNYLIFVFQGETSDEVDLVITFCGVVKKMMLKSRVMGLRRFGTASSYLIWDNEGSVFVCDHTNIRTTLLGHWGRVMDCCTCASETMIVSGDENGRLVAWDLAAEEGEEEGEAPS